MSVDSFLYIQYIKREHSQAEIGQHVPFSFQYLRDSIELILDHTPQKYPFTGWTIQSHFEPCKVSGENTIIILIIIYSCIAMILTTLVRLMILFLHLV